MNNDRELINTRVAVEGLTRDVYRPVGDMIATRGGPAVVYASMQRRRRRARVTRTTVNIFGIPNRFCDDMCRRQSK